MEVRNNQITKVPLFPYPPSTMTKLSSWCVLFLTKQLPFWITSNVMFTPDFQCICLEPFWNCPCPYYTKHHTVPIMIILLIIMIIIIIIISNYWMRLSRIRRILQVEVDNILRDLQHSSYPMKAEFNNCFIIHSKYFQTVKQRKSDGTKRVFWVLLSILFSRISVKLS